MYFSLYFGVGNMVYRHLQKFHEIHLVSYRKGQLKKTNKKTTTATFSILAIMMMMMLSVCIWWSCTHSHILSMLKSEWRADVLVGVCGVRGSSGSACVRVGSNTGSSTTLMLLLCMMSCSMLKISSAREHLKANIPAKHQHKWLKKTLAALL